MTSEPPISATPVQAAPFGGLLAIFVVAIFVSAALLFAVQPMFTKMVLPQLGGAAAVWSVALVFFQTALLAGYAYAHLITRLVPGRRSLLIHIAVMSLRVSRCRCTSRRASVRRRNRARRCGCSACSRCRSGCRSLRSRPMARCCRHGSRGQSPGREGSLFSICGEQCRKFPCAGLLSGCDRAVHPARAADLALDRGLLCPDRLDRGLRRVDAALSGQPQRRDRSRRTQRRRAGATSPGGYFLQRCRPAF